MRAAFMAARRRFIKLIVSITGSALGVESSSALPAYAQLNKQQTNMPPLSPESLYDSSVKLTSLTGEAADRLAIRKLVDAWAHCADRRRAEQQASLFIPEGVVNVYEGDPGTHKPVSTLRGRQEIKTALAVLNKYSATLHLNGQSDVVIHGDNAIGESYCMAHQLWEENGQRKLQTVAIRYYDKFGREGDAWFFTERNLIIDDRYQTVHCLRRQRAGYCCTN